MRNSFFRRPSPNSKKTWKSKANIDSLIQALPYPFAIIDFNGYILDVNPAFEKVYGWNKREIIKKYIPMVPPGLAAQFFVFLTTVKEGKVIRCHKTTRLCKDRSCITVSIDMFLLVRKRGEPVAAGEISKEISNLTFPLF